MKKRFIVNIALKPGSMVQAGDLLVQQDTSTEQAQLREAGSSSFGNFGPRLL
jgi:multidrug efflux pump subunit AcrA (membrane-fusion protein)